jgi:hypothetical protein
MGAVFPRSHACRAEVAEVVYQPEVGTLVKQECHTGAGSETDPFGGFGENSSPVTIALA